jgi:hypothetical protein
MTRSAPATTRTRTGKSSPTAHATDDEADDASFSDGYTALRPYAGRRQGHALPPVLWHGVC